MSSIEYPHRDCTNCLCNDVVDCSHHTVDPVSKNKVLPDDCPNINLIDPEGEHRSYLYEK